MVPTPVGGGTGTLKGTVTNGSGTKLSGVLLQVVGNSSATTNKGGKYSIQNVAEGQQFVIASHANYSDTNPIAVTITAGATATLNITLEP